MLTPFPSWTSLTKKYFFEFLRLIWKFRYLSLKVRSKIEIRHAPDKKIFFLNFFDVYGNFSI